MKAFTKDIVRTITHSKKRFLSIAAICALGVTMMTGLVVACLDLRASADELFDTQRLFDISVQSTLGLTADDVTELSQVEGVEDAEGTWQESAYTRVDGKRASVDVKALMESGINEPYVLEGTLPEAADEVAVTSQYLKDTGKKIGDTLTFETTGDGAAGEDSQDEGASVLDEAETEVFTRRTYTITASVIDPTNITAPEGPVAFRASTSADYSFYVTRDAAEDTSVFTAVYLSVADTRELSTYSDAYDQTVGDVRERVDDITPQRERARAEQVRADALETIEDEERKALAELEDAAQELNDAQATLDESLVEALDGQRELDDAQATLDESLADALAGQNELDRERANALQELASAQATIDANRDQVPDLSTLEEAIASIDAQAATLNAELDAAGAGEGGAAVDAGAAGDEPAGSAGDDAGAGQEPGPVQAAWDALGTATTEEASAAAQQAYIDAAGTAIERLVAQIDAGVAQIDAAVPNIDGALAQLEAGMGSIEEALTQVNAALGTLDENTAPLTEQLTQAQQDIEAAEAELAALDPAAEDYAARREELTRRIEELTATAAQLEAALAPIDAQRTELEAQKGALQEQLAPLTAQRDQLLATKEQRDELVARRAELLGLVEGEDAALVQLAAGKGQATVGLAQARAALAALDEAQATLDAQRIQALAQLDAAQATLDDGMAQIASGQAELDQGRAELADGLAQIADGQAELDEGRATYEEERADALQKIADARAEIEDIGPATWYVQDRTNLGGYSSVDADTGSIEGIARVIPVIFFVVAVLVSLTTATRMVEEERGLIGLYKALGYSKARILSKYLVYTLAAALLGGIVGDLMGFIALPLFLFTIFNVMYQLPILALHFDAFYAVGGIALFIVGIVGATFITCRADLTQAPATLMRPKAPRAGSRIFLEHIGPVWRRMNFLNKVTARNIFRYKKRFFMTVFGIMGCTALLICGFAIKDTVSTLASRQYGPTGIDEQAAPGIYGYDLMTVTMADDFDAARNLIESSSAVDDYLPLLIDTVTVAYDDGKESMQMYVIPDGSDLTDYIELENHEGTGSLTLPDDGVLVTNNAAKVLGFGTGATIELKDSALEQCDAVVQGIVTNYLGNAVYLSETAYEELFGALEENAFLAHLDGTPQEQIDAADELAQDDLFVSVSATEQLALDFSESFALINSVVYVVIILAAGLAFVVLFTLSTVNIAEREREIATIKVLGFRPPEVRRYINKETLVLTALGILLGIPAGWALGVSLTYVLALPDINFAVQIMPASYAISAALTVVFALAVNLITNRMLDHIVMVEALKSPE